MWLKRPLVAPPDAVGSRLSLFVHQHETGHLGAHDQALVGHGESPQLANEFLDRRHDTTRIKLNPKWIGVLDRLGKRDSPNLLQLGGVELQNRSLNKGCTEVNPYKSQNALLNSGGLAETLVRISDFLEAGLKVCRHSDGGAICESGGVIYQVQQHAVGDRMLVHVLDDGE